MAKAKLSIKPAEAIVGFAVIIIAGLTYFVAGNQASQLKTKHQELQQKQLELSQLEQKRTELTSVANQMETYKTDAELLKIAYPTDEAAVEALIQTETITQRAGVKTGNLAPGAGQAGKLIINLNTTSNYDSFIKLLSELQNNLRPVLVSSISLSAGAESKPDELNGAVVANFVYQGGGSGAAAANPSVPLPSDTSSSTSQSAQSAANQPAAQ